LFNKLVDRSLSHTLLDSHRTRGDGFPLANMLALVSVDNKDLGPVLAAHIYTVCPTAIPSLPNPAPNASEEELMESLGMLRKDDGTFETFERFLHRTEVRSHVTPNIPIACVGASHLCISS
jgi:GLE1-like protein